MASENVASSWTVLTFLVYIILVYALAIVAHRLARGREFVKEYYLGSRSLGVWTLALTFAATAASGGSYTGFPSLIYTYGWVLALWIAGYMVFPICTMGLLGRRLNQVARTSDAVTLPDIFRDRYDSPRLGLLTSILLIYFLFVYLIAQFKAGGVLLQTLLADVPAFQVFQSGFEGVASGVSGGYLAGLVLFGVAVVAYTAYGGFRAVVLTDVLQGMIMCVGIVVLLPLALYQAYVYLDASKVEPPAAIVATTSPSPYSGMEERAQEPFRVSQLTEGLEKVSLHLKAHDPEALSVTGQRQVKTDDGVKFEPFLPIGLAISFFFLWPIAGAGQAGNMLRLMAFKDTRTLSRAMFAVTIFYGLVYLPMVVIFVCAKTLPLEMEQSDQAMPAMAIFSAPPILAGMLIAAPFAAIMSTVDSFLLMISSAITRDIYQRTINPNVSEKTMRRASLATTVLVGVLVTLFSVNPPRFLQDLIVFGSSSQAATLLVAMALTLYWPRANAAGTACAMGAGFVAVAALYAIGLIQTGQFEPWAPLNLHPFVWGLIGSIVGGVLGTLARPAPAPHLVAKYFHRQPRQEEAN